MQLAKPYLLFLGAGESITDCKTAAGLRDWCREDVTGQTALPGCKVDLGLPWLEPAAAVAAGARSFVIGVAPVGGAIPEEWWPALSEAVAAGAPSPSGLHPPAPRAPRRARGRARPRAR